MVPFFHQQRMKGPSFMYNQRWRVRKRNKCGARARTRKCYSEFVTFHKRNEVSARFCAMPRANFVICDFRYSTTTFFEEEIE